MSLLEEHMQHEATALVDEAVRAHLTIGCAESCTGGMVAAAITAVSGSSATFLGGIVSYAIAVKQGVLGVERWIFDDETLGPVSAECAQQMSEGAARLLGADVAVSVTGIAGPTGAEPGKPVGTVWFGLTQGGITCSEVACFDGDRELVRAQATVRALQLLREGIENLSEKHLDG